jgi:tetratricopeptide (TPR) repeat protein
MTEAMAQALTMLYCYAPEDQRWLEHIDAHLQELKRQCQIISWFDGELVPNPTQKAHLLALIDEAEVDLILLLVSPHFQPLEAFWTELNQESKIARWAGKSWVVAIVLEPVAWTHPPAETINILPREGVPPGAEQKRLPVAPPLTGFPDDVRPLSAWPNQEQAFEQVERWLRMTIEQLWLAQGDYGRDEGMDEVHEKEALAAYEEALRLNPALRDAWYGKAHMLVELKRYEEALHASDEALRLAPDYLWAWYTRANALAGLKRYEEALQAYDEVLRRDATRSWAWRQKSTMLIALGRKRAAHQAQKIARQLGWRR